MNNPEVPTSETRKRLLFSTTTVVAAGFIAVGLSGCTHDAKIGQEARLTYEQEYLGPEGCLNETSYDAVEDAAYYPMSESLRVDPGEFGGDVLTFAIDDEYQLTPADDMTARILEDRDC